MRMHAEAYIRKDIRLCTQPYPETQQAYTNQNLL